MTNEKVVKYTSILLLNISRNIRCICVTWVRVVLVHLTRLSSSAWSIPYEAGSLAATEIAFSNSSTFLSAKQIFRTQVSIFLRTKKLDSVYNVRYAYLPFNAVTIGKDFFCEPGLFTAGYTDVLPLVKSSLQCIDLRNITHSSLVWPAVEARQHTFQR